MTYLEQKKKAFMSNVKKSRLPEGYTEVNYIESTGTQYIDTGITAKSTLRVVVDAYYATDTNEILFGSRALSDNRGFLISSTSNNFYFRYFTETARPYIAITANTRYLIDFDKEKIYINDVLEYTLPTATFDNNANTLLMSADYNGTIYGFTGYVYSCLIYDDGTLVREYVPCLNPNNVAGFYDLVNGQFHGSATSDPFLYG